MSLAPGKKWLHSPSNGPILNFIHSCPSPNDLPLIPSLRSHIFPLPLKQSLASIQEPHSTSQIIDISRQSFEYQMRR